MYSYALLICIPDAKFAYLLFLMGVFCNISFLHLKQCCKFLNSFIKIAYFLGFKQKIKHRYHYLIPCLYIRIYIYAHVKKNMKKDISVKEFLKTLKVELLFQ